MASVPEGRNWIEVVGQGACPDCGFDAGSVTAAELPAELRSESARWRATLAQIAGHDAALRRRPEPLVWSAIEYACHVRDSLEVMAGRFERMVADDDPSFGWWDHEAAPMERRYSAQPWDEVGLGIERNAHRLGRFFEGLSGDAWDRTGTRGDGARFTVGSMARYTLHELHHHRWDARRSAARAR